MLGKNIREHIQKINNVLQDQNLSIEERKNFILTLSEDDMRLVMLEMCTVFATLKENSVK